jgi:ABC-type sugar transport system ATPase subunit
MSIVLERLVKSYGSHLVVNQVSLEIANGELFVLLGASGSGKSTILRMIAGLTPIEGGRVLLHERDVTVLRPQERGVGFVFQNYALFRHMSVAQNVEFALTVRKIPADRRRKRAKSCSSWSVFPAWATGCPINFPAASSSALLWRARLRTSPPFSFSTSRSVRSTR